MGRRGREVAWSNDAKPPGSSLVYNYFNILCNNVWFDICLPLKVECWVGRLIEIKINTIQHNCLKFSDGFNDWKSFFLRK